MKKFRIHVRASSLFFLLTLLGTQSCNKDSDPAPGVRDGVEGSWQLTAFDVSPPYAGITDFLGPFEQSRSSACIRKTTFTFRGNGTMAGAVPQECAGVDAAADFGIPEQATWKIDGDRIVITAGADRDEYSLEVDESRMAWIFTQVDPMGTLYTFSLTFKRV